MRYVVNALNKFKKEETGLLSDFIEIENPEDESAVAPIIKFTIQSDPISMVGINGCQVLDMLKYTKNLFESLNEVFPCKENKNTIKAIEKAIHWQNERTKDRSFRGIEET